MQLPRERNTLRHWYIISRGRRNVRSRVSERFSSFERNNGRQRQMAFRVSAIVLLRVAVYYFSLFVLEHTSAVKHSNVYKKYYTREICNSSGVPEYHLEERGLFSAARFATSPNWVYHDGVCTFKIVPPVSYGVILNVDYYFIPNSFNECGSYIEISEDDEITKICGPKIFFKKTTFVTRRNMTVGYHINKVDSDSIIHSLFGDKNRVFHDEVYIPLDGFVLTATAYETGVQKCKEDQFECSFGRCIWNGLTCDKVNNCGDNKDEKEYDYSDCVEFTTLPPKDDRTINIRSLRNNYKPGIGVVVGGLVILGIIFIVCRYRRLVTRSSERDFDSDMAMQQPSQFRRLTPPFTVPVNPNSVASSEEISRGGPGVMLNADNPPSYWEVAEQKQSEWEQSSVLATAPNESLQIPHTHNRSTNLNPSAPPPSYGNCRFEHL